MGVPKFYRWLSERYPCLSEVISDSQIPEFDNLYLDMNGIIHNCSHPNDDDIHFRISEEQIFSDIFAYIDKLFRIIRPQKVFYMAVDGVAPRAKMNQQRARRFMSARTAEEQLRKAKSQGVEIPTEKRFDSNCITPGTYFMEKLHSELNKWVKTKMDTDPLWRGVRVYLSGHDVPGEGEHKIMDFIRFERKSDGYDPNTRHCMYGLDADLIMLGLCSHEPHFSLLREEVKFDRPVRGKKAPVKKVVPSETTFHLLHLSLLREYLAWEFKSLQERLSFDYDMERIVDDWVLMGFLIGNDFIPHIPYVHIHDDALPLLYKTYAQVLPTLDGYINEGGFLNLKRFETFLNAFANNDRQHFMQQMEDSDFLAAKRMGAGGNALDEGSDTEEMTKFSDFGSDVETEDNTQVETTKSTDDPAFLSDDEEDEEQEDRTQEMTSSSAGILSAADLLSGMSVDPIEDEFSDALKLAAFREMDDKEFENEVMNCWSKSVNNSFKRHKREYYKDKMNYGNISKDELRKQSEGYVRAIQWILHYYYHGCVSWNWFFPHHYAPYISDVVDFSGMNLEFELSTPFKPFEQLLAVLPSASADCLPAPLRELMCNEESPIADFYPTHFETDLNGKKNDWEAVVLIPFIAEDRLLEAIRSKEPLLTKEELNRNSHGDHVLFTTNPDSKAEKQTIRQLVPKDLFRIAKESVVWGLLPNVKLDVFFPGFPTMKHLEHSAFLKNVNVKVFNQPSKRASMVLSIKGDGKKDKDLLEFAFDLIDKEVFVDWPILKMGKIAEIWGPEHKYLRGKYDTVTMEELQSGEKDRRQKLINNARDHLLHRYAIEANDADTIVFIQRLLGVTYELVDNKMTPIKQWCSDSPVPVLLPLLVHDVIVEEGRRLSEMDVHVAFPENSKAFVMQPSWAAYGCPVVIENFPKGQSRATVVAAIYGQPNIEPLKQNVKSMGVPWFSAYEASKHCGVKTSLLARITGFVFVRSDESKNGGRFDNLNIGLGLKLSKKNLEVHNYTKRNVETNTWSYSLLAVRVVKEYSQKFPEVFSFLEKSTGYEDCYDAADIWKDIKVRKEKVAEITDYIQSLPTASLEKVAVGQDYVDEFMIEHLEKALKNVSTDVKFCRSSVMPKTLYRAELYDGKVRPDPEADFFIFDRVVNTVGSQVPFGLQGTIIATTPGDKIEVLFDKAFRGGYARGQMKNCFMVSKNAVINITFGKERKGVQKKVTAPRMSAGREAPHTFSNNQGPANNFKSRTPNKPSTSNSQPWQEEDEDSKKKTRRHNKKSQNVDLEATNSVLAMLNKAQTKTILKRPSPEKDNRDEKQKIENDLMRILKVNDNKKKPDETPVVSEKSQQQQQQQQQQQLKEKHKKPTTEQLQMEVQDLFKKLSVAEGIQIPKVEDNKKDKQKQHVVDKQVVVEEKVTQVVEIAVKEEVPSPAKEKENAVIVEVVDKVVVVEEQKPSPTANEVPTSSNSNQKWGGNNMQQRQPHQNGHYHHAPRTFYGRPHQGYQPPQKKDYHANDPKLTDLKPSTISKPHLAKPYKKKLHVMTSSSTTTSTSASLPSPSQQEVKVEPAAVSSSSSPSPVLADSSTSSAINAPSANATRTQRKKPKSRLAANLNIS